MLLVEDAGDGQAAPRETRESLGDCVPTVAQRRKALGKASESRLASSKPPGSWQWPLQITYLQHPRGSLLSLTRANQEFDPGAANATKGRPDTLPSWRHHR